MTKFKTGPWMSRRQNKVVIFQIDDFIFGKILVAPRRYAAAKWTLDGKCLEPSSNPDYDLKVTLESLE